MYSGKTANDKIHDVATALLPKVLEELDIPCIVSDDNGNNVFNVENVVRIYKQLTNDIDYEMYGKYMTD